jgi:hypothetical protein
MSENELRLKQVKDETFFYSAIKEWLSKRGWKALISTEAGISVPTGPYFPKVRIQPDIVAYKKEKYSEKILSVEVEISAERIYDGIGQCSVYQTMSNLVYLALPKHVCDTIQNIRLFKSMRIGLIEFSERETIRKEMSPVSVNLKFEPSESNSIESTFYNQMLNLIRDFFAEE